MTNNIIGFGILKLNDKKIIPAQIISRIEAMSKDIKNTTPFTNKYKATIIRKVSGRIWKKPNSQIEIAAIISKIPRIFKIILIFHPYYFSCC